MTTASRDARTVQAPASGPAIKVSAIVGFLVFVELTSGFLQGYYIPLIGEIAAHLRVTDADITWFNTVQTLAAGVCVPILAKLGDIIGHRRMLRISIVAVLIGTIVIALAPNLATILIGRVLVGPLAVWLPLEVAIVHNRISGDTARRSIGFLVSALTAGAVIGMLASGIFSAFVPSMTVLLLIPAVVVLACMVIVFVAVPETTVRTNPKIDGIGFALLALFMLSLLWGLRSAQGVGFANPMVIGTLIAAAVLLAAFIAWELRASVPAVNVRLIASRALWPAYVTSFLFGMVLFGTQTITTTFLAADPATAGYGFALAPGMIALLTAGNTALAVVGAAVFAAIAKRIGIRGVLVLGTLLGAAGNLLLVLGSASILVVIVSMVLSGFAGGLLLGALPALVSEVSPADETGIATGIYNSLKTLGGAVAGAVFGVVLAAFIADGASGSSLGGYITVWLICAVALGVCPLALAFMRGSTLHGADAAAGAAMAADASHETEYAAR